MNEDRQMAIIINDLDSLVHRIEALRAHPSLTDALAAVVKAKGSMESARIEIHHADLMKRYD